MLAMIQNGWALAVMAVIVFLLVLCSRADRR